MRQRGPAALAHANNLLLTNQNEYDIIYIVKEMRSCS
jgi:hypothetical protein